MNSQADSYEEIHRRITAGNKWYHSLIKLFKSKKLSRKTKIRFYKTLVRPIIGIVIIVLLSSKGKSCEEYLDQKEMKKVTMKYKDQTENWIFYLMSPI